MAGFPRRLWLAAAVVLPLLSPGISSQAAQKCAVDFEQRGVWHPLQKVGAIAMDDANPCHLMAVDGGGAARISDDGGATWTDRGAAPASPAALVSSGLGSRVFLLGNAGGAWWTDDRGNSWRSVTGLSGPVDDIVAGDGSTRYAVVRPTDQALPVVLPVAASGGLFASNDGGATFLPVDGATRLAVTAVMPDAGVPSRLWIGVGGPAGGLFMSPDSGQTFTRVAGGDVHDLVSSRLAGGGSEVIASTSDGFVVSKDAGVSSSTRSTGTAFGDLALEWNHPSALMALASTPRRSANGGATTREEAQGLPAGCSPDQLRGNHSVPSVFLLTCADGTTYRFRSDGTDLSSTDLVDSGLPPAPTGAITYVTPQPMKELGRHSLPDPSARKDGSIAFDGETLYYADSTQRAMVHRMSAKTGAALPDLHVTGPNQIGYLTYDANRDHLIVADHTPAVWDIDLRTGEGVRLFGINNTSNMSMTFDSATERLLFTYENDTFDEYTLSGKLVHQCNQLSLPHVINVSGNTGGTSGDPTVSLAGLVATGDGLIYAESEDDSTVYRLDRSCRLLATFSHERFSEAGAENDALACDTVTFAKPAIWLRDADAGRVVAYSVESGYCALPSSISVTAPPGVATGQSGTVCAHLRSTAKGRPLGGLPVDLLVAGRGIGTPITDSHGVACTAYVPLPREAGAGQASAASEQPVIAAFLGTAAYRPSSARASLVVRRAGPPPPLPPAPPALPHAVAVIVGPPPPPPVQPPPPPPNVPQQQPITQPQGHPGAQPGAMGALGAAPAPEDEEEAAAQTGDVHMMTGLGDRSEGPASVWAADWEAYALPVAASALMAGMAVRRRRASRVRPQF